MRHFPPKLVAGAKPLLYNTASSHRKAGLPLGIHALGRLKHWARLIKRDVTALSRAIHDPRVPWYAKVLALCVVGYALSPLDLIPDFIPVLGYLDDLLMVPLGILLVVKLIPADVMAEHRHAASQPQTQPTRLLGAIIVIALWLALAAATGWLIFRRARLGR